MLSFNLRDSEIVFEPCVDSDTQSHTHTYCTRTVRPVALLSHIHRDHTAPQDEDYKSFFARNMNPWCVIGHIWKKVLSLVFQFCLSQVQLLQGRWELLFRLLVWEDLQPGEGSANLDTWGGKGWDQGNMERKEKRGAGLFWTISTPHLLTNVAQGAWC